VNWLKYVRELVGLDGEWFGPGGELLGLGGELLGLGGELLGLKILSPYGLSGL
jgi:hypothetical protein